MNDSKYYFIAVCVVITLVVLGTGFEQYLKSQEKQTQLEIKKLELQLKLKEK